MALNPSVRYAGQVATGDPDYFYGRAQNVTVEGDGTGTPLEEDLVNDIFGFQQALLAYAGITPSNTPDTMLVSQYLTAVQTIAEGSRNVWVPTMPVFGAAGDGATDDTAALLSCCATATAAGGTVDLRGKTYLITGPIACSVIRNGTLALGHATAGLTAGVANRSHISGIKFVTSAAVDACVFVAAGATAQTSIIDCIFDGNAGSPVAAIAWASGANLQARGNTFVNITRYGTGHGSFGVLSRGSYAELRPHETGLIVDGTVFDIAAGVASMGVRSTFGSAPTLALPTRLFRGQELEVCVRNTHVTDGWVSGVAFNGTNVFYTQGSALGNAKLASFRFRVIELNSVLYWAQVGVEAQHFLAT